MRYLFTLLLFLIVTAVYAQLAITEQFPIAIRGTYVFTHAVTNTVEKAGDPFPNVSLETEFGNQVKTKARMPLMTGALGSTFVAAKYWDSFAVGGATPNTIRGILTIL